MQNKKSLSERDIITKFIIPALEKASWNKHTQIREEVTFTNGRIFVKGQKTKRGEKKRADILLYYKANIPVAVLEAKDNNHSVDAGMQQALEYAETLDIPVAISSNGDGFVIQYRKNCGPDDKNGKIIITEQRSLEEFPPLAEFWKCYKKYNNLENENAEKTALATYHFDSESRSPRYYQRIAINRTVEAIARGQNRILLVMTTGTDAQTCKVIVLDSNIGSMTEFKQIIGRGTRINEEYGKQYFTIIDFRSVTDKFADKDFDGSPVKIKEVKADDEISESIIDDGIGENPIDPVSGQPISFEEIAYSTQESFGTLGLGESGVEYGEKKEKREKVYIAGVDVHVLSERKQFLDTNGKLITTSVKEYTKQGIIKSYRTLDSFLQTWNEAEKKKIIIEELENQGVIFEELQEEIKSDLDILI